MGIDIFYCDEVIIFLVFLNFKIGRKIVYRLILEVILMLIDLGSDVFL